MLKQKIIILKEEKRKLLDKLTNRSIKDNFNPIEVHGMGRVKKLEESGLITPPLMRRKFLMKSLSDSELEERLENIMNNSSEFRSEHLISTKNIDLKSIND